MLFRPFRRVFLLRVLFMLAGVSVRFLEIVDALLMWLVFIVIFTTAIHGGFELAMRALDKL